MPMCQQLSIHTVTTTEPGGNRDDSPEDTASISTIIDDFSTVEEKEEGRLRSTQPNTTGISLYAECLALRREPKHGHSAKRGKPRDLLGNRCSTKNTDIY